MCCYLFIISNSVLLIISVISATYFCVILFYLNSLVRFKLLKVVPEISIHKSSFVGTRFLRKYLIPAWDDNSCRVVYNVYEGMYGYIYMCDICVFVIVWDICNSVI